MRPSLATTPDDGVGYSWALRARETKRLTLIVISVVSVAGPSVAVATIRTSSQLAAATIRT